MGKEGMAQTESRPVNNHSYSYRVTVTVTYHTADHMHITHAHALTNTHTQKCSLNTTMHAFPRTTHVATHTQQYHKTVVLSHRQSTYC